MWLNDLLKKIKEIGCLRCPFYRQILVIAEKQDVYFDKEMFDELSIGDIKRIISVGRISDRVLNNLKRPTNNFTVHQQPKNTISQKKAKIRYDLNTPIIEEEDNEQ